MLTHPFLCPLSLTPLDPLCPSKISKILALGTTKIKAIRVMNNSQNRQLELRTSYFLQLSAILLVSNRLCLVVLAYSAAMLPHPRPSPGAGRRPVKGLELSMPLGCISLLPHHAHCYEKNGIMLPPPWTLSHPLRARGCEIASRNFFGLHDIDVFASDR